MGGAFRNWVGDRAVILFLLVYGGPRVLMLYMTIVPHTELSYLIIFL